MSDVIELLEAFKELAPTIDETFNPKSNSMSDFNNKQDLIVFIKHYGIPNHRYIGLVSFTDTREYYIKSSVHLLNDLIDIRDMGYKFTIGVYRGNYEATAIINAHTISGLLDKTPCTQTSIGVIDIDRLKFKIETNPDFKELITFV